MEWFYVPSGEAEGKCSVFGLYRNFLPSSMYSDMKRWLVDNPNYQEGDKSEPMTIPRTQIWYQKEGQYFCPRWKGVFQRWCSVKYDSTLERLQSIVQNYTDKTVEKWNSCHPSVSRIQKPDINSCLVNRYRSGADSIKPHRDSPDSFGRTPTIIGLSMGSTRTLVLQPTDTDSNHPSLEFKLSDNTLFLMAGQSQIDYLHSIPKVKNKDDSSPLNPGERFSLTFREWNG